MNSPMPKWLEKPSAIGPRMGWRKVRRNAPARRLPPPVVACLAAEALELDGPPALRDLESMVFIPLGFDDHRCRLVNEIGSNGRELSAKVFHEEGGAILSGADVNPVSSSSFGVARSKVRCIGNP